MPIIDRPAVEVQQGHLKLYLTYVTPEDLMIQGFFDVDRLEPQRGGYQRILNLPRARRLSRHLTDGYREGYANLPTTIFLATDKKITFDSKANRLSFNTDEVCPFSVVDGQHRIAGLLDSAKSEPGLLDFRLPATIATSLDETHQMYHFYIVNTTQRPVDRALEQQITTRFTDMHGVEDLPYLPSWLDNRVTRGTEAQALRLVEFLNENHASPLRGRIHMANDPSSSRGKIRQAGLVTIFKDNIFTGVNPIMLRESSPDKRNQIVLNYFRAIDSLLVGDEGRDTSIVFKSNGLFFFALISKLVFTSLYARAANFTEETMAETIRGALGEMEDFHEIAHSEWWFPGGGATSLNRAGARIIAEEFLHALNRSESSDGSG